jgi:hypothetical protein
MQTSDSIQAIAAALVGFHKEVGKIPKDAKNPFFKSKYASLSGILEVISEPLTNNGLSIVQFPEGENGLTTRLCHSSGEWMEATYSMKPSKDDPQGRGSTITYQRRYAVGAILSLNIDEDDDGNAASKPNGQPKQQPIPSVPTKEEKQLLIDLLENSDLNPEERLSAFKAISDCSNYKTYETIQHKLEARKKPIDQIHNPSQKQINQAVQKKVNATA